MREPSTAPLPPLSADEALIRRVQASGMRHPARRLTISYAAGLLMIAALTAGAYLRVEGALREQRGDAAVVNVAGKQRMLSQKITKTAMALAVAEFDEARRAAFASELREALAAFRLGHTALRDGNAALGVPATGDAEAVSRLTRLDPSFTGLVTAAEALGRGEAAGDHLPSLLAEQAVFLPEQDALVSRYAELSRAKIASLEADHARLFWITLGLLLAEAVLVFEPAARAMRRQLRDLHEAGEVMSHEARHDSLTGLPNRNALLAHLEGGLRPAAGGEAEDVAVYFLDFDRFKAINDSLGHEAGDRLLRGIAGRAGQLVDECRAGRLRAFRLGGDEFVLVLDGPNIGHAVRGLAERALLLFAQPHVIDGQPCVSTASIGIATARGPGAGSELTVRTASELLRNADLAMMQAKAAGKGRYLVFDDTMYRFAQRRQRLEHDLRATLADGRLGVGYLAVVSADDDALLAVEAVPCWVHEELGPIGRTELLEVAEESGLVHGVGDRLFEAVAADVAALGWDGPGLANPRPRLHLGVTRAEASHPAFLQRLVDLRDGCPGLADRLSIGFDEASLARGTQHFAGLVERVSGMGVETCIDDLGGSGSSLADLARLRIDRIRIHPRAAAGPGITESHALLIPRAMVALARGIGIGVTAAGVDSRLDAAAALDLGVDAMQGRHWGEPAPLAEVLAGFAGSGGRRRAA